MQQTSEIKLLSQVQKTLSQNPNANQRDLASSTNLSLGMTNALIKRFYDKGWLYMKKISGRNIQYALTPTGLNELMHRSSRYFMRTAKLMKDYKDIICNLIYTSTCNSIIIIGTTDLEFLFDFACSVSNVELVKIKSIPAIIDSNALIICSDEHDYNSLRLTSTNITNVIYIENLLQSHIEVEELT